MSGNEKFGWALALLLCWVVPVFVTTLIGFFPGARALDGNGVSAWFFATTTTVFLFALLLRRVYLWGRADR